MATWPWERAINPHYEEVKAESGAWFRGFKAFNPQSQKAFDRCDFARFAALAYPRASREHLRTGCDLIKVYFIIDEYTDIENAAVTRDMVEVAIDALRKPHTPRPKGEVILGEVVRQFWELAIKTASSASQRHFLKEFTDWLPAIVAQSADRDQGICRSVDGYLAARRDNIALRPSFMVLEIAMELPDEVYYHPEVVELTGYITDIVIIDNDIASYNREQATGDENYNLITAAIHEYNLDVGSAIAWAASCHTELQRKFVDGLKKVPSWGSEIDDQLQEYIHG
ncbi:isoprenoid synthase domain-containing protein, partial [Hygrophoropsis aurantiaca]